MVWHGNIELSLKGRCRETVMHDDRNAKISRHGNIATNIPKNDWISIELPESV